MKPALREVGLTPDECLAKAKIMIEADDAGVVMRAQDQRQLHMGAAEYIADAMRLDKKLTQAKVAEVIGKTQPWVSALIKWKLSGYAASTAFGPQAKQAREKKRLLVATDNGDECPTCKLPEGRDRRALKIREEKYRAAGLEDRVASINEDQRLELILLLSKLGHTNITETERAEAAKAVDAFRTNLGLLWDDLIVKPQL